MAVDPFMLMGLAGAGTSLARLPFDVAGDLEEREMTRRRMGQDENARRFQRLMDLVNGSQATQGRLSGVQRLMRIRNGGGLPNAI